MDLRRRNRQTLLLLSAILLPATVLVPLAIRLARQETELADARVATERRHAVEQVRRELAARLETIKLRDLPVLLDSRVSNPHGRDRNTPIVFVAPIEQDQLVLPWAVERIATRPNSNFVIYRREAEQFEFQANDFESARESYTKAQASAAPGAEQCSMRLSTARVMAKAGQTAGAASIYRAMLNDCDVAQDEDGVSLALYAAERLISSQTHLPEAHAFTIQTAGMKRWWTPPQSYLLRSLLGTIAGADAKRAREAVSDLIRDTDQVLELASELRQPVLVSSWLAFGHEREPWLVTTLSPETFAAPILLAVSSKRIGLPDVTLLSRATPTSNPVGEGFGNLHAEWPAGRFVARDTPIFLYAAGLAVILAATGIAGYLLLRDVNREVRTMEMRAHFVASVSHELKTPLTAIRMFAETLADGRAKDESRKIEYLRTIVNESERLSRLVDNVLDFARIEHGKKIYHMRPIDLRDVVRSSARAMQYPLAQQGFNLEISMNGSALSLIADPDALQQAVLNLLTNAMKYSGDSRRIDLTLHHDDEFASIEVTDRGLGIGTEDQKQIFDKFFRVRSDRTDAITGAGLGLTLAVNIAAAHGGRLDVISAEGRGSTFALRIPLNRSEAGA